jgi:hypothetical protein
MLDATVDQLLGKSFIDKCLEVPPGHLDRELNNIMVIVINILPASDTQESPSLPYPAASMYSAGRSLFYPS